MPMLYILAAFAVIAFGLFVFTLRHRHAPKFSCALFVTAILLALAFGSTRPALSGEPVNTWRGIGGDVVAPLDEVAAAERTHGWTPRIAEWFLPCPPVTKRGIGHSAGADKALQCGSKIIVTIDPTIVGWMTGCPKGARCTNYYAPADAFPFVICCGGYPIPGAKNIQVQPNHLLMPKRYAVPAVNSLQ